MSKIIGISKFNIFQIADASEGSATLAKYFKFASAFFDIEYIVQVNVFEFSV